MLCWRERPHKRNALQPVLCFETSLGAMQREAGERYAWVVMACFDDHPSNRNELCEMYGLDEKSSFGSVEAAVEALHEALGRYRLGVKPAGLRGYYGQVF